MKFLNTNDRFSGGDSPIPTRNFYSLFGDGGHDLFRHGLAEITPFPVDNNANSDDPSIRNARLNMFNNTADYSPIDGSLSNLTAKEDPVMFGFDIVIRAEESPLFSHTLSDSVQNFFQSDSVAGNAEMLSRVPVWENFKKHFFQFFRDSLENRTYSQSANEDNPSNSRFYYYLKKVGGLDSLVENNNGDTTKSFIDYGKDKITLEFSEDVTLRIGRMAQLYKTLYWSRLSGKTMIPENLLRFDCDIIVSEVRNFARVKKIVNQTADGNGTQQQTISGTDLQILRDSVNRYVYTLYECQLFFDKMPHPGEINLGEAPVDFTGYTVGFNYKYSTLRVDNFNPITNTYVPLNNGTYDPFAVTPFDKFLNSSSSINGSTSSANSGISDPTAGVEPEIQLAIIPYNEDNTVENDQNQQTNSELGEDSESTQDTIEKAKENEKMDDSISSKKKQLLDEELNQFKGSQNRLNQNPTPFGEIGGFIGAGYGETEEPGKPVTDHRWGRPQDINKKGGGKNIGDYEFFKDNPYGNINSSGANNKESKSTKLTKQLDDAKSGLPKESWLNSDSPGARFAKRVANTGIAAANQIIASRVGLLNKTLNKIAGSTIQGYKNFPAPRNIYEQQFNGQLYLASKMVKDSFEKFVGESISDLFKKK